MFSASVLPNVRNDISPVLSKPQYPLLSYPHLTKMEAQNP